MISSQFGHPILRKSVGVRTTEQRRHARRFLPLACGGIGALISVVQVVGVVLESGSCDFYILNKLLPSRYVYLSLPKNTCFLYGKVLLWIYPLLIFHNIIIRELSFQKSKNVTIDDFKFE